MYEDVTAAASGSVFVSVSVVVAVLYCRPFQELILARGLKEKERTLAIFFGCCISLLRL